MNHQFKNNFPSGSSEMSGMIRSFDWSKTSLGDIETWPQCLKIPLSIMLNSKFPMFIWWGAELINFYNDAYRPSLGKDGKHPGILGIPAKDAWPEIWPVIKPLIDQVLSGGEATWSEDQLIAINRNGKLEDVYWTFSYSALNNEAGNVGGVLVTCTETTDKILTYKKLEESRNLLQFAIEAAELATWDLNPVTNKFTGSDRLKEWHSLKPGTEFDLKNGFDVVIEKDKKILENAINEALDFKSGGVLDIEYAIKNPVTGQQRIVRVKGKASFDENNIASRLHGTLQDVTQQVIARRQIEESEERFRTMAEGTDILIAVADETSNVVYFNKAWEKLTGWAMLRLIEYGWLELVHPEDREAYVNTYLTAFKNQEVFSGEFRILNKSGNYSWLLANCTPRFNNDGTFAGYISSSTDITGRKSVEKALQESEYRFRSLADNMSQLAWMADAKGDIFWYNQRWYDYTGTSFEEMKGWGWQQVHHPDHVERVVQKIRHSYNTGEVWEDSFPLKARDGSYNWFLSRATAIRDVDGKILHWFGTNTDITQQKIAEEQIRYSEERFRNMVMNSPVAKTILKGEDFTIEIANKVMIEKLWRKKKEDVIGKKLFEVFPELKEQKYAELLQWVMTSGKIHKELEAVAYVQGDDGLKKFYVDFQYAPLSELGDGVSGIMITANDVTERVEARQKVEESEERSRIAIEAANMGTFDWDMVTNEFISSPRLNDIFGFPGQHNITHQNLLDSFHPDDKAIRNKAVAEAGEKGNLNYEARIFWKDKSIHWVKVFGKLVYDNDHQPLKMYGTVADITETKNTLSILQESEERFRNVANTAPVLIWMAGVDQLCNFFNTAWLNFRGRTLQQEAGNGWTEGIHPEDSKRRINIYETSFGKKEGFYIEYRLRRNDGEYRWVSDRGIPRFTKDGIFEGYIGACIDINERLVYEKKLQEEEERLNIVIDASGLGTWELNLQEYQPIYSLRYMQIMGYREYVPLSREELTKHIHPEDMHILEDGYERALKTGILDYEIRIIWNDGSVHWIHARGKLFYDDNKRPLKIVGTIRDITEEKFYQKELLEREQKFRLLADSMPQFVWTGNAAGNLNYFNQSVYLYSGLSEADFEKGGWLQIVHPDEREENVSKWVHAVKSGEDFIFEHRFRRYDGEYRWQLSRAVPQRDADGNIQMWVGTSTDIQEQKIFTDQLEQQVLERTRELEKVNDALGKSNIELEQFAYIASHDLQEPLRKIQFFSERLEHSLKNVDDTSKMYYQKIQQAADRMKTLIRDLLEFSRLSKRNDYFVKTDLNVVIANIRNDFELLIEQKGAIINVECLPVIDAIPLQMQQLFYNLLNNSLKFAKKDIPPVINLSCKKADTNEVINNGLNENLRYFHLVIKDNGIGFEQEYAEQIFVIFQRLNDMVSYSGTGIGLALCRKIVLNHHGKIYAEGKENEGAAFHIFLPEFQTETSEGKY